MTMKLNTTTRYEYFIFKFYEIKMQHCFLLTGHIVLKCDFQQWMSTLMTLPPTNATNATKS